MFSEAGAYERFMGRWSRALAPQFIAFSGTRDGDRVLDVGCGTGTLSLALEAQTRKSRITGIDISPEYVTYARKQSSHRTSFEVGDAQALRGLTRVRTGRSSRRGTWTGGIHSLKGPTRNGPRGGL